MYFNVFDDENGIYNGGDDNGDDDDEEGVGDWISVRAGSGCNANLLLKIAILIIIVIIVIMLIIIIVIVNLSRKTQTLVHRGPVPKPHVQGALVFQLLLRLFVFD